MAEPLLRAVPVFALIGAGIALRRAGVLDRAFGHTLMRLVFYLLLPALLFVVLAEGEIDLRLARMMAAGPLFLLGSMLGGLIVAVVLKLPRPTRGTLLATSGIMMGAFNFPLLLLLWGPGGLGNAALTRGVMVDVGNALMSVTLVQYIAARHGSGGGSGLAGLRSLLTTPLLWSTLGGVAVSRLGGPSVLPEPVWQSVHLVSQATIPLILIGLGVFLEFERNVGATAVLGAACRVGVGLLCGYGVSALLGLTGLERSVVLVMSAAPSGSSALVFSSRYDLDPECAARIISLSVLTSLAVLTALLLTGQLAIPT